MKSIEQVVAEAKSLRSSDIHLINNLPVKVRVDGQLENLSTEVLNEEDLFAYAKDLCGDGFDNLMKIGEFDGSRTISEARCRIHVFLGQGVPSISLRILSDKIPDMMNLGLPEGALRLPDLKNGIVLVTGETGSGKSTTLAAMLDYINHNRKAHIVTLEDPIEYLYTPDQCAINQREVGKDTKTFASGLRASLREDPDIILIGEMRDKETIETAITAAETGHLVFGTLHTKSAAESIDRMVQVFPADEQTQIRLQLSMVLQAVISQQLLKKKVGGRILAAELMVVTPSIRNLIRDGKTPQIQSAIVTSAAVGGQTMDQAIIGLFKKNAISKQVALDACDDEEQVLRNIY
ncbi:MAG: PilT/PilU family type 4a pilus ATPase [Erysipelotrichaceae bacterium]|nr:PilT/PilU family type 4a pilus ATPase [Erysipelotrichaceae bacterium]